jgi:hypothetical protein
MPNYYRQTDPADLRDLPQSLLDEWAAAANPKLADWLPAPAKPAEDAIWAAGQWLIPPPPSTTAEQHLNDQGYGGNRPTILLYQKLRLDAEQLTSPKLSAVQQWMDDMIVAAALDPNAQRPDWPAAPYPFEAVLAESLAALNS